VQERASTTRRTSGLAGNRRPVTQYRASFVVVIATAHTNPRACSPGEPLNGMRAPPRAALYSGRRGRFGYQYAEYGCWGNAFEAFFRV
jgi:hypothetical protein